MQCHTKPRYIIQFTFEESACVVVNASVLLGEFDTRNSGVKTCVSQLVRERESESESE